MNRAPLSLPPIIERIAVPLIPAALLALNSRVPISRICGATRSGSASIVVAGPDPWAFDLPSRFFRDNPERKLLDQVPVWQLETTLEHLSLEADLIFARVDRLASRLFFHRQALRVPEWISTGLTVPADLEQLVRSSHSLRDDIRKVRRNGFSPSVTHGKRDFEAFYDEMYVPFTTQRHGQAAFLYPRRLLRSRFHRGGILWLKSAGGEKIGGVLLEHDGPVLHFWSCGTRNGDLELEKAGVISGLYFHAIDYAKQQGLAYVDFHGVHACLTDGLLRFKRKWGMSLQIRKDNYYEVLIRWREWSPVVASFLTDVPVLHCAPSGLRGITVLDTGRPGTDAELSRLHHSLWTPGLERLVVVSPNGWEPDVKAGASVTLLAGSPSAEILVST